MKKYGKIRLFSGRLQLDWGNTAQAATAGSGSKGLPNFTVFIDAANYVLE